MYTLIIADDEEIERISLQLLLTKEFPQIEVVGMATNGVEFISLTERLQPDIAIVDVNMPGINGIDAIDLLRARGIDTRFIINTAYDEFDYAQRALSLKIEAYILKPEKRNITIQTIGKICKSIDETRHKQESQKQMYDLIQNFKPVIEREIMLSIFINQPAIESFETYCTMHEVCFKKGVIISMIPKNAKDLPDSRKINQLRDCVQKNLKNSCTFLSNTTESNLCLMIFIPPKDNVDWQKNWLIDVITVLMDKISIKCNIEYRAGISSMFSDFSKVFYYYKESLRALKVTGDRSICLSLNSDSNSKLLNSIGIDKQKTSNLHVIEALDYIEAHYHQDISLGMVAEQVGISLFYLSRLIKQELGCTFVEYLTRIRMEEARHLAETTKLSIVELSKRIGYINPTYFCRIFKKYTGKTIGEIREETRKQQY